MSELATNAYRYSDGPASVRLKWANKLLLVSVWDTNPRLPRLDTARDLAEDGEGGRGLMLVQLCADDWGGFAHGDGGKLVWFEVGM